MEVEREAILTCTVCGVDSSHILLYLSNRLRASQCRHCGATQVYSRHTYADYARDVAERSVRLVCNSARRALRISLETLQWPVKGVYKPFGLLGELGQVVQLERRSRHRRQLCCRGPNDHNAA